MGKLINVLTTIAGIWNTVTEFKIECFQEAITKEMVFYHAKVINGSITDCEFHSVNNRNKH